jgi:tight adherence protein B
MSPALFPALLIGGGLAAVVVGLLTRGQARTAALAEALDLPFGMRGVDGAAGVDPASRLLERVDRTRKLEQALTRAHMAMRPEQFAMSVAAIGLAASCAAAVVFDSWIVVPLLLPLAPLGASAFLARRSAARRKAIESQLPDALSVVAGSLSAGHTFLRSLQLLCEEAQRPLGDELARVVRETQLGTPVVDALENMADRVDVPDVRWVVQAIRVQQEVGGKLADLLHTLADFMRARDEVRREINVLTAEGRLSAWVLGALPVLLIAAIRVLNPAYLAPLMHGGGLIALIASAVSVFAGVVLIRRMVRIEV